MLAVLTFILLEPGHYWRSVANFIRPSEYADYLKSFWDAMDAAQKGRDHRSDWSVNAPWTRPKS